MDVIWFFTQLCDWFLSKGLQAEEKNPHDIDALGVSNEIVYLFGKKLLKGNGVTVNYERSSPWKKLFHLKFFQWTPMEELMNRAVALESASTVGTQKSNYEKYRRLTAIYRDVLHLQSIGAEEPRVTDSTGDGYSVPPVCQPPAPIFPPTTDSKHFASKICPHNIL